MATSESLKRGWYDRMAAVIDYVQSHLDEELTASRLAALSGFSLHHFHRVFRGTTGESVMGLVRRLRLERAAQQLRYRTTPVTTIAFDIGYQSHEAFTRAFRARFGVPPRAFRETGRSLPMSELEATTRQQPQRTAIGVRHVGPYAACEGAWQQMTARADAMPLISQQLASAGLVYDDPEVTSDDQLRYDACFIVEPEVADGFATDGTPWIRREIPAGTYAVGVHRGPYDTLLDSYVALIGHWLPRRAAELVAEPVVEIYVVGPELAEPPDYITEICVRLAD
ncbi:MAG: AraC family transcriptional regulator [Myxococcales bacterium FL481]|nr:MAG: AraC family transcriptional regulator [Myxococcales bacterium FL481]